MASRGAWLLARATRARQAWEQWEQVHAPDKWVLQCLLVLACSQARLVPLQPACFLPALLGWCRDRLDRDRWRLCLSGKESHALDRAWHLVSRCCPSDLWVSCLVLWAACLPVALCSSLWRRVGTPSNRVWHPLAQEQVRLGPCREHHARLQRQLQPLSLRAAALAL